MFNEEVSYCKNYSADPETITLEDWLNACKNDSTFKEEIEAYRMELETLKTKGMEPALIKKELSEKGFADLKAGLPMVIVGAVCEGSRRKEAVVRKTG